MESECLTAFTFYLKMVSFSSYFVKAKRVNSYQSFSHTQICTIRLFNLFSMNDLCLGSDRIYSRLGALSLDRINRANGVVFHFRLDTCKHTMENMKGASVTVRL